MQRDCAGSNPQVSVIITAYNAAGTIRGALHSLSTQDFRDFETIVVDDGSQDETVSILRREFPHVIVITQPNAGPAAARNRGAMLDVFPPPAPHPRPDRPRASSPSSARAGRQAH